MSFDELGLSREVLEAIEESGYTTPTPIQEKGIPLVLAGRDVVGASQTGTGKTAAFSLPMLHRLGKHVLFLFHPKKVLRYVVYSHHREDKCLSSSHPDRAVHVIFCAYVRPSIPRNCN